MDRGRSFRILGLNETATKKQVELAYAKKVERYKGPDYAEEPEYADKKLKELYAAYQEARDLASTDSGTYRLDRTAAENSEPERIKLGKTSRLLEEERDAAEHNPREKFHQWMERLDDKRQRRKDQGGIFAPKSDSKRKKPELKLPKLKELDFSKIKEKINEAFPENELFQDADVEVGETGFDTGEVLTETGTAEKKETKSNEEFVGTIISIAIALIFFFVGSCEGDSNDIDYEEPAYSYIYDQSIDDVEEADSELANLAASSYMLLTEQTEHGTATLEDDRESYYRDKADLFAQKYWGKDSISLVSDYLYQNYGDYAVSSDDPVSTQLDAIFAFYGFASLDTAQWYDQPYTGERMKSYRDYLDYLNQFYDAQQ